MKSIWQFPLRDRRSQLLGIALPIVGGMLSQNLLNLVDIAMVGRLGDSALAATGVGSFANYLSVSMVLGLSTGVQAIAARRLGQGRDDETAIALNGGLFLALIIGVTLSIVLGSLAPTLFPLLNSDPAVVEQGVPYLQVRLLAIAAVGMNFAFRGYWSAVHLTRLYFRTIVTMHVLNIFLNWVLIFGKLGMPALGVVGAGTATTISIFVGTLLYFLLGLKHAREQGFLRGLPKKEDLKGQIKLSLPASMQQIFASAGLVIMIWILGQVGTAEVAAANVLMTLALTLMLPSMGLGIAASTLVGNALGKKNIDDAELWGWQAATLTVIGNLIIGVLLFLFAKPVLSLFIQDPETVQLAYIPLLITAAIVSWDNAGIVLMNAIQGAGATGRVMVISFVGQWLIFLPLAWIVGVGFGYGLLGIWSMQGFYRTLQAIVFAWTWRQRAWSQISV
ncbi:MAG: MATE family efflux transporter [Xanthomonadales bacterium]|nr:MATE family efflux transporter [Xanthomonadales bacterium]